MNMTYLTEVFQDFITNNTMFYLVRGLKLSDDNQVNGGIALGIIVNNLFSTLQGNVIK